VDADRGALITQFVRHAKGQRRVPCAQLTVRSESENERFLLAAKVIGA
jgi:hypothetical protein